MRSKIGGFRLLSDLRADTRGSIIIQATLVFVALFAMIGLALDGGRFMMAHSDLQDLADGAALAGAQQLNGTPGSMTAADTAARALINNVRWYDTAGAKIASGSAGVSFYATASDAISDTSPLGAGNDKLAKYIKVVTGSWTVAPTFIRAVSSSSSATTASAVAMSDSALCVPATMMLCNPNETATATGNGSSFAGVRGAQYIFSTTGNTGGFSPGVFNLLDGPNGGSDPAVTVNLAAQTAPACTTGGVSPAQGQKTNATINGINVRFDQQPNGNTSGVDLTPAPIKIDGMVPKNGNNFCANNLKSVTPTTPATYANCATDHTISCALPRDRTTTAVGGTGGSQIGSGTTLADLQAYWSNHHPGTLPATITTRYDLYAAEAAGTGNAATWLTQAAEPHAPSCSSSPAGTAARRIVQVAIVDCNYWGVKGNSVNNIRIGAYADFFLTEASDGKIYTEYLQTHKIDTAGSALNSIVKLVK